MRGQYLNIIALIISVLALIVSAFQTIYTRDQAEYSHLQALSALEQTKLARESLENTNRLIREAEFQDELNSRVFSFGSLRRNIYAGEPVTLQFFNYSTRTRSYKVAVSVKNGCLYWGFSKPTKNCVAPPLPLNNIPEGVRAGESFGGSFRLYALSNMESGPTVLEVYLNGKLFSSFKYQHEPQRNLFVFLP